MANVKSTDFGFLASSSSDHDILLNFRSVVSSVSVAQESIHEFSTTGGKTSRTCCSAHLAARAIYVSRLPVKTVETLAASVRF